MKTGCILPSQSPGFRNCGFPEKYFSPKRQMYGGFPEKYFSPKRQTYGGFPEKSLSLQRQMLCCSPHRRKRPLPLFLYLYLDLQDLQDAQTILFPCCSHTDARFLRFPRSPGRIAGPVPGASGKLKPSFPSYRKGGSRTWSVLFPPRRTGPGT